MSLFKSIEELALIDSPTVVSIGNYDGVHLGHQFVVEQLLVQAKALGLPSVVITFDPLAKEYFALKSEGIEIPARLSLVKHRAELLMSYGVDHVLCLPFDESLVTQSAQSFVEGLLVEALSVRYLVVGDDFRFGYKRQGDFDYLVAQGESHGFEVASMSTFLIDDERVSSGRVRLALQANDFSLAKRLLGRDYSIKGLVSRGQQLGRTIGFPTANIALPNTRLPFKGVYLVKVDVPFLASDEVNSEERDETQKQSNSSYWGVANLGTRPTVDGVENRLEVHLFDFGFNADEKSTFNKARQAKDSGANYDLYDLEIEVFFVEKVRDERKFDSVELLKDQINQDVILAKQLIGNQSQTK